VRYLEDRIAIELDFDDCTAITLPLAKYPELRDLAPEELRRLEIGFGGVALCLNERDLHISIAGLIAASRPLTEMAVAVAASEAVANVSKVSFKEIEKAVLEIHTRLAILERSEVRYWTSALNVPEDALLKALEQARRVNRVLEPSEDGSPVASDFRPAH
jgi:hypothetical protein